MLKRTLVFTLQTTCVVALVLATSEIWSQGRGRGGGGGRSAGHAAANAPKHANAGPAMTRPGGAPKVGKQEGGTTRPKIDSGKAKPNGGFHRPTGGDHASPKPGGDGPRIPGKAEQPKIGGDRPGIKGKADQPKFGNDRPGIAGKMDRPNAGTRPKGGASSDQLNDFLGGGGRPSDNNGRPTVGKDDRPKIGKGDDKFGKGDRPNIGDRGKDEKKFGKDDLPKIGKDDNTIGNRDLTKVGDRRNDSPNINVGNVNIGNSVDYSKDQKAWVNNQHNTGNLVRANSGNRYAGAYNSGVYRRGAVGGYPYSNGWNNRGAYYGWRPVTYAALGTFMGATLANAQPRYYAYGTGGNVYYENNIVYVDGQPAGTTEEYAQKSTALLAAAPAEVTDTEWLPLGTFAFTREGVDDSQAMMELAVNKQGVIAGTYYNEATGASRSLKGMLDQSSQRAAIGFADGKNTDLVLETGINNLTQDEAPGLLHQGTDRSTPVLLVRLQPPAEGGAG